MWTSDEDEKLLALIEKHGARRWNSLASAMETKTAKQCRRRWSGHLTTEIKEHEWTEAEDLALLDAHEKLGNKWTAIAKLEGGRTDNGAKNRFKALVDKQTKSKRRRYDAKGTARRAMGASERSTAVKRGRKKPAPRSPTNQEGIGRDVKRWKVESSFEELAATRTGVGKNGISPSLFVSSPTNSASADRQNKMWRPSLSIKVNSREQSAAGASGMDGFKTGASLSNFLPTNYSVGKTLSLSCAELDLLREVQEMVSPRVMANSHGGGSNANSAFNRYGGGEKSNATNDMQSVMNWLLSARPAGGGDGADNRYKVNGIVSNGDAVTVSLAPNEDGTANIQRGTTLKHFLSIKADAPTPKGGKGADSKPISIPSFTSSELNLLLNALGTTPSVASSPVAASESVVAKPRARPTRTPQRRASRRS